MKKQIRWLLIVAVAVGTCSCCLFSSATAANLPDSKATEVGLFQAMEQGLKQSETLTEQMEEAQAQMRQAWQLPFQATQSELVETLQALQSQVEALSKKVEMLEQKLAE